MSSTWVKCLYQRTAWLSPAWRNFPLQNVFMSEKRTSSSRQRIHTPYFYTQSMRVTGNARDWSLRSRVSTPASPNATVGFSSKQSIAWWRHAWLAAKRVCQSRLESASEVTLRQMDDFKLICMDLLRLKHYIFVQVIYSWWSLSRFFLVSSQILSQLCKGYSFSGWFGAYYMHFSLDVISSKVFSKCCRI